jgi:ribosomal peptide maturation radical SAM protein 1
MEHSEVHAGMDIRLVNMPFAATDCPSIALTQLKAVTEALHGDKVRVEVNYLNHDFGQLLGPQLYGLITNSMPGFTTGLGEWLFRSVAFPEVDDNQAQYFARYQHHFTDEQMTSLRQELQPVRARLPAILDALIERYRLHEADMVGVTSMFFQNLANIALAQRLKKINPKQIIVMGGANCEGTMGIELASHVPVLDFVFSGNSLISFPQLVGYVLTGQLDACRQIDGVFCRDNCRSVREIVGDVTDVQLDKISPRMQLKGIALIGRELDINTDVPLDYDDFLHSAATLLPKGGEKPQLFFETSRGCWWGERAHCTFCGLNGGTMAYRSMSPDRAVALMTKLFARYSHQVDLFSSVDNILPKEYITEVFARLRPPDNVGLFYEVKADLSEEDVRTLAGGGMRSIQPGIEALATSTLKLMRKGTTAFHGVRLLGHCKKYGITPNWNLLVGFPGEGAEVYEHYSKVMSTLFHLPPPSGVFPIRFDRYSPYFMQEREYGLQLAPYDFYKLCYPFAPSVLRNLAYYFQDLNHRATYVRDANRWLPVLRELVERWQTLWNRAGAQPRLDWVQTPGGIAVQDTRDGQLRTHWLSNSAAETLKLLKEPGRDAALEGDSERTLAELTQNSLIFSERGRSLSLVSGVH